MNVDFEGPQAVDPTGTQCVVISANTLMHAVDRLVGQAEPDFRKLKVNSGEHLAAILATAFLGAVPVSIDTDGGVDLIFETRGEERHDALGHQDVVAIEVKTLAGKSREATARVDHLKRLGQDPRGTGFSVAVESVSTVMPDIVETANKAATSLARKVRPEIGRHAFVIIHPLDRFTIETMENTILSPALPHPNNLSPDLDSLWVLWAPEHLTVWSPESAQWVELIFAAYDLNNPVARGDEEFALLQHAEGTFLSALGGSGWTSPYIYRLRSAGDDPG